MDFGNLVSRIFFFLNTLSYVTSEKVKWLGNDGRKKRTKQHVVIS